MGRAPTGFQVGADADIVALRVDLSGLEDNQTLDSWIFSGGAKVDCVFARGKRVVSDGAHFARGPIRDRFRATMLQFLAK